MMPYIIPSYSAILALLFLYLSVYTIKMRRKAQVSLGDNNQPELLTAIRAHANFSEYVPLSLILLGFLELQGVFPWALHFLGVALLVGRCLHAIGLTQGVMRFRVLGMVLTMMVLVVASVWLLWRCLPSMF
ncbi:MAG: MAPEG family protein [Gammaproteobacteria bacterium]|nr:MAPEG family protein [Gammaproteobacteria bacterium]